ncbi:MAG: alpha-D-ribose 1-methylphosphonate 5-triphosphate diphosphatase, partial [Deltaproteobacteria bacterium]
PRAKTDFRVRIRAETAMVDHGERLIAAIERHHIGYVVFNDHLAEGFETACSKPHDFALWAAKTGRAADELLAVLENAQAKSHRIPRHLCDLATAFDNLGVIFGSHDDPDAATRERYRMLGAQIAEFPTSHGAASAAKVMGNPVIMGAPNVVRGKSQAGNIAAQQLIADGLCDALVSDYHLPALALAAFALADRGVVSLAQAWAMISTNPARILRLKDRGEIAPGKRADLVAVNARTREIEMTIAGGRITHLSGDAALRMMDQPQFQRLAAE